mmetsp:Transcript_30206/g.59171  ORF Transcript_30206/g.59171 Transcript_30206/m.59171 type:complete len:363 (+) Transcript_30206:124-1212(+)
MIMMTTTTMMIMMMGFAACIPTPAHLGTTTSVSTPVSTSASREKGSVAMGGGVSGCGMKLRLAASRIIDGGSTSSRRAITLTKPAAALKDDDTQNHHKDKDNQGNNKSVKSMKSIRGITGDVRGGEIPTTTATTTTRRRRRVMNEVGLGVAMTAMILMMGAFDRSSSSSSFGKVVYGEDITEPTLDRDFSAEETTQAELAWERYRLRRKAGLATPLPTKTNLPPQRYLAIIYTYKQESFEELKNYLRRAAEKETVSSMQGEFRRMAVSLLENAFNDVRQSMYYLPLAVAQKNAALGFNLQRRYDVVERELEELDRDINLLAYSGGRSDITNDDLMAVKQSIKDLERATDQFTEYATEAIAQL